MRQLLSLFLLSLYITSAKGQETRNAVWYIPSSCSTSKINGFAIGPFSGCLKDNGYDRKQIINGIDIEIIGIGFFVPLAAGPIILNDTIASRQIVNGCVISPGGYGGLDAAINGLNLSGIGTLTGKTNGLATGLLFCMNSRVNGIAIGGIFNNLTIKTNGIQIGGLISEAEKLRGLQIGVYTKSESTNGLQIGLFNNARSMKGLQIGIFNYAKNAQGLQIGLFNKIGKRLVPFLNFQF